MTSEKPTVRLPQPVRDGTYSITRKSSSESKIAVSKAGHNEVEITVEGTQLRLSRDAARQLVLALLEQID